MTEDMLWVIAQIFCIGICLGSLFLAAYFIMYLMRGCIRKKGESAHREIVATKATQLAAMYPGYQLFVGNAWDLTQRIYILGLEPLIHVIREPEEQCVFYCIILSMYWVCISTALYLYLVAGFKVARNFLLQIGNMLGV